MKVSELARKSDLPSHVVRYYARIGLLYPRRNPNNGYKLFTGSDLVRLQFIRQAKTLGFTLDEIQEILSRHDSGQATCPMVREVLAQRIEENRQRIDALREQQARMEQAMEQWQAMPDQPCDARTICHLIETSVGHPDAA